jgi:ubiquinone/menaquinone biosynthesis C-methylase UbiE
MSGKPYFERVAKEWDTMRGNFFSDRVREKAIAAANLPEHSIAVDLGAGTGFLSEALLAQSVHVVAVDESRQMLAVLQKKVGRQPTLQCIRAESQHIPLPDRFADAVFANMYLHHVEYPANAIAEAARLLRKGGMLVITDLDEHNHEFLRTEHHDRWLGFKRTDVARWFAAAGLNDINVTCLNEQCSDASLCGDRADISIFIATGRK